MRIWHDQQSTPNVEGLMAYVEGNRGHNFLIWHDEDLARRALEGRVSGRHLHPAPQALQESAPRR